MKGVKTLIGVSVTSAALVLSLASPAFAWHPKGKIVKEVQNVTQSGQLKDANSANDAVSVKPGDIVKFVITVRNDGTKNKDLNDMYFTKVTDQLPAGLSLVEGVTNKDLGLVEAGKSKEVTFTAKVTSEEDGSVICNTAKFTGDSKIKDAPQKGQDDACVVVTVPPTPEEPEEPEVPETPEQPETPTKEVPKELPSTGPAEVFAGIVGASSLAGATSAYIRSRRSVK